MSRGNIDVLYTARCATCPKITTSEEGGKGVAERAFKRQGWKHAVLHLGWQCPRCLEEKRTQPYRARG